MNDRVGGTRACRRSRSGIGLSTGEVAAALLGSEERLEYTVVGDAVNLCQRLQQFAADGQIVLERRDLGAADAQPRSAEDARSPSWSRDRSTPVAHAWRADRHQSPISTEEAIT